MPTGYTAMIEEGASFEDYIWACVRAFGVAVTMRDAPLDKAIPEKFQPEDYHYLQQHISLQALHDFENADEKKLKEQYDDYVKDEEERYDKRLKEYEDLTTKYSKVQFDVKNWIPPTDEHKGLKEFMLQQIDISLPRKPDAPNILSFEDWRKNKLERLNWNLNYHKENYKKECDRVDDRNKWLEDLRKSLKTKT